MKGLHFTNFLLSQSQTFQPNLHPHHPRHHGDIKGVQDRFPFLHESIGTILVSDERKRRKRNNNDSKVTREDNPSVEEDKDERHDDNQQFISVSLDDNNRICFKTRSDLISSRIKNKNSEATNGANYNNATRNAYGPGIVSMNDVAFLAQQCETFVFGNGCETGHESIPIKYWSPPIQGLVELGNSSIGGSGGGGGGLKSDVEQNIEQHEICENDECEDDPQIHMDRTTSATITASTLLAMNGLESAIRKSLGYATGKAPLLRTMILQIATESKTIATRDERAAATTNNNGVESTHTLLDEKQVLSEILQRLLLPNPIGLNLRNIMWHGFIGNDIPRSWLALVIVLTTMLLQQPQDCIMPQNNIDTNRKSSKDEGGKETTTGATPLTDIFSFRSIKNPSLEMIVEKADKLAIGITNNGSKITVDDGSLIECCRQVKSWLPGSHRSLFDLAIEWAIDCNRPTCSVAILTILLEHGLRLDWCRLNERMEESVAQPGAFFVTLDGHGQRHIHDLILYPFLTASKGTTTTSSSSSEENNHIDTTALEGPKNNLISHLGGPTIALLTDLFASSCGGPNIRATICHGLYDEFLEAELSTCRNTGGTKAGITDAPVDSNIRLWDMLRVVLIAMKMAAAASSQVENDKATKSATTDATNSYRPVFSYTATTLRFLCMATSAFAQLENVQSTESYRIFQRSSEATFGQGENIISQLLDLEEVKSQVANHLELLLSDLGGKKNKDGVSKGIWTSDDIFLEQKLNNKLAACGTSTRTLLKDVAEATLTQTNVLKMSLADLDNERSQEGDDAECENLHRTRRRRRRNLRIVHSTNLAVQINYFAALVAIESFKMELLETSNDNISRQTMLKAVERSRMVVSTVSNFLYTNPERAQKAVKNYVKGKAIKAIAASLAIKEAK